MRTLAALCLASTGALAETLAPGSYDVTYRLEVPHVEQFAVDRAVKVCLAGRTPLPKVLSGNNPLAHCAASGMAQTGRILTYDILCPGRRNERSEAAAAFVIEDGSFQGRIRMTMGGKNMTFVEVQTGVRTGPCGLAAR